MERSKEKREVRERSATSCWERREGEPAAAEGMKAAEKEADRWCEGAE